MRIDQAHVDDSVVPQDTLLTVTFQRDNKKLTTEPSSWSNGTATWNQVVGLNSTVYKTKEGVYMEKKYQFILSAVRTALCIVSDSIVSVQDCCGRI